MTISNIAFALCAAVSLGATVQENRYAEAARAMDETIEREYAYLDKLPGGVLPHSSKLRDERVSVHDRASLLRYAENRMASLSDHHAITGNSFADSWAVIPTYADLWITNEDDQLVIDAVREDSPAAKAGIRPGQRLTAVSDVPIFGAVTSFWAELGLNLTPRRAVYAAQVLAAGRRDRDRQLTITDGNGTPRRLTLSSLYMERVNRPPITVESSGGDTIIRFNNSLGHAATIAMFDDAMGKVLPGSKVVLDLRDTPSGGNTTVARAIMGWFVTEPRNYQVHNRPSEKREHGVARQWVEQVLPRRNKYHNTLPTVLVGRWTGSMGEGLAIGFDALGATVQGTRMAGLNGAVEDICVGDTDLTIKLPTERLLTTTGLPREDFEPWPIQ